MAYSLKDDGDEQKHIISETLEIRV